MSFNFVKDIDSEAFNKIETNWKAKLKSNTGNVSESYYDAKLDYARNVANNIGNHGASSLCAILNNNGEAEALLVLIHNRTGAGSPSLRMIEITVQPELNLADTIPTLPLVSKLAQIASKAIVGGIGLTFEAFPSSELKIYTDMPLDREFFTAVFTLLNQSQLFSNNFDVTGHSNWLVIKKI